jgi:hypothetical protein
MKAPHDAPPHDGADSVEHFAEKNAISRAQAFKEISSGRLIARKVGSRTIITHEDAAKWRSSLPKAAAKKAATKKAAGTRGRSNGPPAWMQEQQRSTPTETEETK